MAQKTLSYQQAFDELQDILEKLEGNEVNVDELAKDVKRASELIKLCKGKLKDTETEIEKIIEDMEEE